MYLFIALFMGASGLYAQDCATGYCPATITVHHKVGDLSAATGDITYNVVKITATASPTCWITQNLGATSTPTSINDYSGNYAGWVWQGGRKQGFIVGVTSAALTNITTAVNETWSSSTDPCTLSLGSSWHLPTGTDLVAALSVTPWASSIKGNNGTYNYWTGTSWNIWTAAGGTGVYWVSNWGSAGANTNMFVWNGSGASTWTFVTGGATLCHLLSVRCTKLVSQ